MQEVKISYSTLELEKTLGEAPKPLLKLNVRVNRFSSNEAAYLYINRISFKVCLHAVEDRTTSKEEGRIGMFELMDALMVPQEYSSNAYFYMPINSIILERMLDIRDRDKIIAFKIDATVSGQTYYKRQHECIILDMLQFQQPVYDSDGKTTLILLPSDRFNELVSQIHYTEIMRIEVPLYHNYMSINQNLRQAIDLMKHAASHLKHGNNEGAVIDLRKAITNHLLDSRNDKNDRILNANIEEDLINKAPTDTKAIYKEIIQRVQDGLRSVLRITDKFIMMITSH